MFDISGGAKYSGKKVPVERSDGGHWRFTTGDELMAKGWTYPFRQSISDVTVASFADMDYNVSFWSGEPYQVPMPAAKSRRTRPAPLRPVSPADPARVHRWPRRAVA